MAPLEAAETDDCEGARGSLEITADAEAHLVETALPDQVPAGILREVRGAAAAPDRAAKGLEQAGGELRQGRLPGPVRPDQRHDLAAPQLQTLVADDEQMVLVGKRGVADPADGVSTAVDEGLLRGPDVRGIVVVEPGPGPPDRTIEADAAGFEEEDAIGERQR